MSTIILKLQIQSVYHGRNNYYQLRMYNESSDYTTSLHRDYTTSMVFSQYCLYVCTKCGCNVTVGEIAMSIASSIVHTITYNCTTHMMYVLVSTGLYRNVLTCLNCFTSSYLYKEVRIPVSAHAVQGRTDPCERSRRTRRYGSL